MGLKFRDFFEERKLLDFLKAAKALSVAARFRRDTENRRMSPIGRRDPGDQVCHPRTILRDADAGTPARARIPVCHVRSRLFVLDPHEADSRRVEEIDWIEDRRADYPEDTVHAVGDQGLGQGFARRHDGHRLSPQQLESSCTLRRRHHSEGRFKRLAFRALK